MQESLMVITLLTFCNFLIFIVLVGVIVKAGRQRRNSSFSQIKNPSYLESIGQVHSISDSSTYIKDPEMICVEKCDGEECACRKTAKLEVVSR